MANKHRCPEGEVTIKLTSRVDTEKKPGERLAAMDRVLQVCMWIP